MEEIGKLIHELFDDQKMEIADLKDENAALRLENRKMAAALEKIKETVTDHVYKSSDGSWYMQSIWGRKFEEIVNLLGIELKEEEEE